MGAHDDSTAHVISAPRSTLSAVAAQAVITQSPSARNRTTKIFMLLQQAVLSRRFPSIVEPKPLLRILAYCPL